jgi:hypothetical protein
LLSSRAAPLPRVRLGSRTRQPAYCLFISTSFTASSRPGVPISNHAPA